MTTPLDITEKNFLAQVRELAGLFGWRSYHAWLSVHSPRGWPDLALVRPPRLVLCELKTERGKLTPAQREWLDLLAACDGVEVRLWRPSDWDEVVACLR